MSKMPLHFSDVFAVVVIVLFLRSYGKVFTAERLDVTKGETLGFNDLLLNVHV